MFRSFLHKALAVVTLAAMLVGGGFYWGYETPRDIDPQDYMTTKFMPYESGIDNFLSYLDGTKKSLRIAIYSFTDSRITDKLLELHQRGVTDIKLLLDKSQTVSRSGKYAQAQIARLRAVNIEVTIGTSEEKHNIMHLKDAVRDNFVVWDGSWNFTKSANTQGNDFNIIPSRKRAAMFLADWNRMYAFMSKQDQTPWIKDKPAVATSTPEADSEPEPE